jgi:hypothetical protein
MSSSFNAYTQIVARRKTAKGAGKVVGEFFGTIVRASKDEYVVINLMLEGHNLKLDFKSHEAGHDVYEATFAETIYTTEIDQFDSGKFPDTKSIAQHVV